MPRTETPLSEAPFSLHSSTSGYIELVEGKRYAIVYYVASYHNTRRFRGATYQGYDIEANRLVFITPRGSRIAVPEERFTVCEEVT